MVGTPRSQGSTGKPLKSELHHWWPKGLSRFWADDDGRVTRLSWDGEELRLEPAKFGAIRNGHRIRLQGPWDTTVEPLFDDADGNLPRFVDLLHGLPVPALKPASSYIERAVGVAMSEPDRAILGEILASLIIRCPAHRDQLHRTTEYFHGRTGDAVLPHDDALIAGNIHQHFRQVVDSLKRGGKIVLLRTETSEFVMGEGYLSTLRGTSTQISYHCLLPLTPTMAVLAFSPQRYRPDPAVSVMPLTDAEVDIVNEITQIYSRDYLFFRRRRPEITEHFAAHRFLRLQYEKHGWVEDVMASIAGVPRRMPGMLF